MTTTVVHINEPHDIYIGRANSRRGLDQSRWHNPNKISPTLTREGAINLYERWLRIQLRIGRVTREDLESLRGKTLGCWCKPEACHGDVIAWYADHAWLVTASDDQLFNYIQSIPGNKVDEWAANRDALRREFMVRIHPPGQEEWEQMVSDAIGRAEGRAWDAGAAAGFAEGMQEAQ